MASHLLDIYSIWLHVESTPAKWKALAKKEGLSLNKPDGSLGFVNHSKIVHKGMIHHISVYIDGKSHKDNDIALVETCAHEATHAALTILSIVGQTIRDDDEHVAYLTGWITQWLYQTVRTT